MKVLRVVFVNGDSMEWSDSSGSVWVIDNKARMVYVVNAKMILMIPFENIKIIGEMKDETTG